MPAGRVRQEQSIEAPQSHLVQPKVFVGKLEGTEPDVSNIIRFVCSGDVVTVTRFKHGQEGQTIKILGDGNTTLEDGTYIKTNTAADKLLAADIVYTLTNFNGVFVEDE